MQSSGNCEASKIRAFVGIRVPAGEWLEPLREALTAPKFPGSESLRLSPDSNLHITLKFLGSIPEAALPELSIHLAQVFSKHAKFDYRLKGLGYFKQAIWLGIEPCTELDTLAGDVETCCKLLGYAAEIKPYKPHVTVARYGKAAKPPLLDLIEKFGKQEWSDLPANEACLFKSETLSTGAKYSVIDSFPLGTK